MTADLRESRLTPANPRQWVRLILAWLVVLVPSAWGVGQVVIKSLALFR